VDLLDHWPGSSNLLWRVAARGEEAVLKLYLDAGQVRSRREYDAQALFGPLGLAPQPLWLDRIPETLPRSVLVYRWVEGAPFDAGDFGQWQALASVLAQVHSTPVEDLDRFSPHPLNLSYFWSVLGPGLPSLQVGLANRRLPQLSDLVGRLHELGQRAVDAALPLWEQQPPTAVHGDLRLENVINRFGAPVLLDWELFGLGDPALEVARFLHNQRHAIAATWLDSWLAAYLDHLGDGTAAARSMVYHRLLPLQDAAYLLGGSLKLSAEERRSPELRADAALLAETLRLALVQAAAALAAGNIQDNEGVATECAALFVEEMSV
jgi:aminoglycoside phosphotransferase (APT) family kinase protein